MYVANLRLWNFRKFGEQENGDEESLPGLVVNFQKGLNLIVGENDSGKTAVIDALRILLDTRSSEYVSLSRDDFYNDSENLRIECDIYFDDEEGEAKDKTASQFVELISHDDKDEPFIKATIVADKDRPIIRRRFGDKGLTSSDEDRLDLIKAIYLRPLRDATTMLKPGYKSRVSDVLSALNDFKDASGEDQLEGDGAKQLKALFLKLKTDIEAALKKDEKSPNSRIIAALEELLLNGTDLAKHAKFSPRIQNDNIASILALFELLFDKENYKLPGLGHMNILVIALELMLLAENQEFPYKRLRCCLVEELEAHLHPQLQLNVVKYLENSDSPQVIATTHSPNLVSHASLDSVIYLNGQTAFSMGEDSLLSPDDKIYLERFLDVTKANVFFARGLIVTEGYSDAVLVNALAKVQGKDLVSNGISIVVANVRGDGLTRFARLFISKGEKNGPLLPVSLVGDRDAASETDSPLHKSYIATVTEDDDKKRIACLTSPSKNLEAGYFSNRDRLLELMPDESELHGALEAESDLEAFLKSAEKKKTLFADEISNSIEAKVDGLSELECFSHLTKAIEHVVPESPPEQP